jgi:hypothetical protein
MNQDIRTAFPSFEIPLLESLENEAEVKTFKSGEEIVKTGQRQEHLQKKSKKGCFCVSRYGRKTGGSLLCYNGYFRETEKH